MTAQPTAYRHPLRFDPEKAVEVLLFLAKRINPPNLHRVLKLLYLADKLHLERYGRLICGDTYVAMKSGPVPSGAYDIVKDVRGDGMHSFAEHARHTFQIHGYDIAPFRDADVSLFSDSDVECLEEAVRRYGEMSGGQLKELSHDAAYQAADENDFISIEAIAGMFPDRDALITYLRDPFPG